MPEELKLEFDFSSAFNSREKGSPLFLRHKGIQGSLKATNVAENNVDKVKLVLRGFMVNVVGHGCPALYQPHKLMLEQKILKLMDVQDSVSSRYTQDNGSGETFHFDFPLNKEPWGPDESSDDEEGMSHKYLRTLPSSLNVFGPWCANASGQACCQAEVIVKYEFEATAYHGDDVVSSIFQEVRVYDSPDSHPPPVHTADFPEEYVCTQEKRLKRMYLPSSRLTISITEPKPVEIRPHGEVSMAAFPVKFIMRSDPNKPDCSPPGKFHVRINSLLKAVTFIATAKMDCQPTVKQARCSSLLAAVPKYGRSYHRKLRVCHWTRGHSHHSENDWVANALVWLPIAENSTPAPTFFTPYVSRRYSVSLRLDVKGEGKAVFNLQVPLQIVYPMDTGSADAPSYEVATTPPNEEADDCAVQEEERLPIYVR